MKSMMNFRNAVKGFSLALMIIVSVACSTGSEEPAFNPLPIVPVPTPTVIPGLVEYSDELGAFSIKYPDAWNLDIASIEEIEKSVKDLLESKIDADVENFRVVFAACDDDFQTCLNVTAESLTFDFSLNGYYSASKARVSEFLPSHETERLSRIDVGGIQAILDESRVKASDIDPSLSGLYGQTSLTLMKDRTAWTVTCEFPMETNIFESCESIVRTFRIFD